MPAPDSARPTSEVPSVRPAYSSAQKAGLLLTLLSFLLLWPGITQPIMTVDASISMFGLKTSLFHETRSIWQTVIKLHELNYTAVGVMILSFSVIIPLLKLALILYTWFSNSPRLWRVIAVIGKWSMVDVFVIALLIAFFSAQAAAEVSAQLEVGFYWFLAFCLSSVCAGILLEKSRP
ncbi:MAG: hypothetical protein CMI08_13900 [Oceanospirillaceae bacterium]|uniref:paraquat-inducible protein A n=1 Tax=unclassified Thalassolituus TaxID=2624967 RepID=UPI000C0ABFE5|nr:MULTISPECIES: paraquat-inducible protein A [unclassified Thalassolituus]MAK91462.1 hypothetical protein [Thalassolituus sp.]MAS23861.1 hypothetical protein [Oceanospirillaceae bacterium]MAY00262.1 hypothetical protein [Oceanospirillaceae bacterium]MBL34419.1 hypothetical protein [Oceanospirillaceae bacterium]MBS54736.1 hypothetical protein [Oceanospirillaceae bacterium]|tara:strand:+ start:375 stop:908 length:534 start_codon:yes stop_codon:yes gene_type:complete